MMMRPPQCAHESAVREAAAAAGHAGPGRQTGVDPAILPHLAECAECRETFEVASWMARFASDAVTDAAEHNLPDPARIWWRARLLQRWDAETRATAPLDIMHRVEVIGGLIAAVVLLATMWPELHGFGFGFERASGAASGLWPTVASLLVPSGLTTLVLGGAALLGLMAVFTVHQLLIED